MPWFWNSNRNEDLDTRAEVLMDEAERAQKVERTPGRYGKRVGTDEEVTAAIVITVEYLQAEDAPYDGHVGAPEEPKRRTWFW